MLSDEDKRALSNVRYEHAEKCLKEANILLKTENFMGAANRSYYAVFHAMRSVLALDGIDRKHHSGIISEFRRLYVKTGIFQAEYSEIIDRQSFYRTNSDYNDFFIISKKEVVEQVADADRFLIAIRDYLKNR